MKPGWLVFAFACGAVVGVVGTRVFMDTPAAPSTMAAEGPVPLAPLPVATEANSAVDSDPARPFTKSGVDVAPPMALAVPVVGAQAGQVAVSIPVDDASIQRIDAGPIFNEVIARPSQPGFENQLGEAHRALERETRNDGWAYTMEGEIQNAMVNEVSTGEFRADHIECRATLCEVRLSGKGNQAAAIKRWVDGLGTHTFSQRLFMNYSSSISNSERVDSLMIFRKPPPAAPKAR